MSLRLAIDAADDPRVATRGRPGASAVALGRRIMESANPNLKRHSSLTAGKTLSSAPVKLVNNLHDLTSTTSWFQHLGVGSGCNAYP